jgi:hypothetical protein
MRVLGPAAIDAVVTWVNGADAAHRQKREAWLSRSDVPQNSNGTNPHRWACSDELSYCLRSIGNHAPWIARIWIVTDAQTPDLSGLPEALPVCSLPRPRIICTSARARLSIIRLPMSAPICGVRCSRR